MDLKQVEIYLERYWEGSSTLEEEKYIRDFFSYGTPPPHLEMYRSLFTEEDHAIIPDLDQDFDNKIMAAISEEKTHRSRYAFMRVAAVALVLIISSIAIFKMDKQQDVVLAEDTVTDPEEALEETKRAFMMIAGAMNKGEEPVNKLRNLDEANQKIKRTKE